MPLDHVTTANYYCVLKHFEVLWGFICFCFVFFWGGGAFSTMRSSDGIYSLLQLLKALPNFSNTPGGLKFLM